MHSPNRRPFLSRPVILLSTIISLGLIVRLIYLFKVAGYPNFKVPYAGLDAALYHGLAKRIASGDLVLGSEVYYYSPLYAYFLGGLYALFGQSPWVARLANVFLGVSTIGLVYLYSFKLFRSTAIALIAALGTALYGPYLVFDTSGLKGTLGHFLVALSLLLISRADEKEGITAWIPAGLVLGLALNICGQLTLFLIGLGIWLLVRKSGRQGVQETYETMWARLAKVGCLAMGISLAIMPFTLRNYFVAGDFVLTTATGGIHFYIGNNGRSWGGYTRVKGVRPNAAGHFHDARRIAERKVGRSLAASEVSDFWKERAMRSIKKNPQDFLRLLGKKTLLLLNLYEIPNNENYQYLIKKSPFLSFFPGMGLLLPLGLTGLLLSLPQYRRLAPLILFFFCYGFGVILSLVTWRYRMPLTLVLWPFAGFCVAKILEWAREGRFWLLGLGLVFVVTSSVFARAPVIAEKRTNRSMKSAAAKMRACEREQTLWRLIATDSPTGTDRKSELWLDLVELRNKQYDTEGAIALLQQALREDPKQAQLWRALSNMQTRLGNSEAAKKARENFKEYQPALQ